MRNSAKRLTVLWCLCLALFVPAYAHASAMEFASSDLNIIQCGHAEYTQDMSDKAPAQNKAPEIQWANDLHCLTHTAVLPAGLETKAIAVRKSWNANPEAILIGSLHSSIDRPPKFLH